jgi:predicted transcriptional regulator
MKTKPKIEIDIRKVEALAERGLSQEQIAAALGISEGTLYARKKENEEFDAAIKRGRSKGIGHVANKLMEQINAGNIAATIFFLKAQAGWRDANKVEHSAHDGGPIHWPLPRGPLDG